MTLPNFIIVGAAKSGTTVLAQFLREHPEVFMSPVLETHYFLFRGQAPNFTGPGDNAGRRRWISDKATYEALFTKAEGAKAIGDKCVFYLCRPDVFPAIKSELADPRVIAILRNPADRAFSAYCHMVRDGRETESTFSAALAREDERRDLGWEYLWHYRRLGLYAAQVEALFQVFGRDRVRLLLYDDLRDDPGALIAGTYRFLDVDDQFVPTLSARPNVSGVARSRRLNSFVTRRSPLKKLLKPLLPLSLRQQIFRWNVRPIPFPDDEREALAAYYEDDVRRLASLSRLDLSRWLPSHASGLTSASPTAPA